MKMSRSLQPAPAKVKYPFLKPRIRADLNEQKFRSVKLFLTESVINLLP